jgi:hypothetical protein
MKTQVDAADRDRHQEEKRVSVHGNSSFPRLRG